MTIAQVIETGSCSDIGGREEQQDRVAVFAQMGAYLLVVADGMGGHDAGGGGFPGCGERRIQLFRGL